MGFVRQIIGDRMSGGVLAVLVAVCLLLQGGIGGYGQAAMAAAYLDDPGIICSVHGTDAASDKRPADGSRRDCCLTACQVAASLMAALPAKGPALAAELPVSVADLGSSLTDTAGPRSLGLAPDARGPPAISA